VQQGGPAPAVGRSWSIVADRQCQGPAAPRWPPPATRNARGRSRSSSVKIDDAKSPVAPRRRSGALELGGAFQRGRRPCEPRAGASLISGPARRA
jgi:hypothetical protein